MSLKRDLVCPNCDGRAIWRIEEMLESGRGGLVPIGVTQEQSLWTWPEPRGTFETLICRACGYTEWYAKHIGSLHHDPDNGVHLIVNDIEKNGPYR